MPRSTLTQTASQTLLCLAGEPSVCTGAHFPSGLSGLQFFCSTYVLHCPQLCLAICDPTDCSLSGSSVHGTFQARILPWGGHFLLQRILLTQGSNLCLESPVLEGTFFTTASPRKPYILLVKSQETPKCNPADIVEWGLANFPRKDQKGTVSASWTPQS